MVVFELRQSPLHWNNRGCKVFSLAALKQQSRRHCAANGFALSPIRAAFSDSIRRVSKLVSEVVRPSSHSSQPQRRKDSVRAVTLKIGVAISFKTSRFSLICLTTKRGGSLLTSPVKTARPPGEQRPEKRMN